MLRDPENYFKKDDNGDGEVCRRSRAAVAATYAGGTAAKCGDIRRRHGSKVRRDQIVRDGSIMSP